MEPIINKPETFPLVSVIIPAYNKQLQCIMRLHPCVGLVYAWSVDINEEDRVCGGFHVSPLIFGNPKTWSRNSSS
jgi:hypothetical protein